MPDYQVFYKSVYSIFTTKLPLARIIVRFQYTFDDVN